MSSAVCIGFNVFVNIIICFIVIFSAFWIASFWPDIAVTILKNSKADTDNTVPAFLFPSRGVLVPRQNKKRATE
jgi:hypothetical protein